MHQPLILHEYPLSGNCYKIRLVAAMLGIALQRRSYDILVGETRTPAFLATVNPDGRIPVLQIGDDYLPESNAACLYLADGSALIPQDAFARARMFQWLFWEQYNHEPNIATLRFWRAFVGRDNWSDLQAALEPGKQAAGDAALARMDAALTDSPFLVGASATVADIVLYAYTHVAPEGGFDLAAYPHVQAWLARVAALPGHVPIDA